jgi:hypothetical protein
MKKMCIVHSFPNPGLDKVVLTGVKGTKEMNCRMVWDEFKLTTVITLRHLIICKFNIKKKSDASVGIKTKFLKLLC